MHSFLWNVQSVPYIAKSAIVLMYYNPISRQTYSMIIERSIGVEISYGNFSRSNRVLLRYRFNTIKSTSGILTRHPFEKDIETVV